MIELVAITLTKLSGKYIICFISIEELGAVIQNNLKYPNFENWDKGCC